MLPTLDEALLHATTLPPGTARDNLLMGLAGVRLSLFSGAAAPDPFTAPAVPPTPLLVRAA